MANKNIDNDEYHFADFDSFNQNAAEEGSKTPQSAEANHHRLEQVKNRAIMRNASIVVILIVLAMLAYKFMGSFLPHKTSTIDIQPSSSIPSTNQSVNTAAVTTPTVNTPVQTSTEQVNNSSSTETRLTTNTAQLNQKLAAMEIGQQNMMNDITTINNQIGGINTSINNLSVKMAGLTEAISALTAKLEQQSDKITALTIIKEKSIVKTSVPRRLAAPVLHYYINAVIPGRAWLIATNGSTLTVREGSRVPGYGIIKLIDANQGRVLTSSGQVIKFSQQDS